MCFVRSVRSVICVVYVVCVVCVCVQIVLNLCSNALKFSAGQDVLVTCGVLQAKDLEGVNVLHGTHPLQPAFTEKERGSGGGSHSSCLDSVPAMSSASAVSAMSCGGKAVLKQQWLLVSVADSGEGISQVGLAKLFVIFSKLTDPNGLNTKGSGLGVRSFYLLSLTCVRLCAFCSTVFVLETPVAHHSRLSGLDILCVALGCFSALFALSALASRHPSARVLSCASTLCAASFCCSSVLLFCAIPL